MQLRHAGLAAVRVLVEWDVHDCRQDVVIKPRTATRPSALWNEATIAASGWFGFNTAPPWRPE